MENVIGLAARREKSPLWNAMYQATDRLRKLLVELKIKWDERQTRVLNVVRDRTNWVVTLQLAELIIFNQEITKRIEEAGFRLVEDGTVVRVLAEFKLPGRVLMKELEGKVSLGRLRRYVHAFAALPWKARKTPVSLDPPKVPANWREGFIVQTVEGLFMYFPYVDRTEEFERLEDEFWSESKTSWDYPHRIVFASPLHQIIEHYTSDTVYPKRIIETFRGCSRALSLETILALFEDPPYEPIKYYLNRLGLSLYASELFTDPDKLTLALSTAEDVIARQDRPVIPALYIKGTGEIIRKWKDRLDELKAKIEARKTEARDALEDPKKCPPLPHFRRDFKLLPHQAAALGSLDHQPNAIVGVEMGGGKTLLSLYDALVNMARGRARRPCIVMPNNLIYQFKDEIARFTASSVNAIVVNTFTVRRYGLDRLKELIQKAPPNTVVLCSYEWLANDEKALIAGTYLISPNERAGWLIGECGVDMVTLDEAHYIKNITSNRTEAVLTLSHAPVRRVMSGTLTPNKLIDLVVPVSFVKPHVFRGVDNFLARYTIRGARGAVRGYTTEAPDQIRAKLEDETSVLFSRAAWIYLLPKRRIKIHRVELPEHLKAEYDRILRDTMAEIMQAAKGNPELKAALEGVGEQDLTRFPHILQKLTALDRFLTAPATVSELVQQLPPQKQMSPKIAKVKQLIEEHFARDPESKVIVMCRFKDSAKDVLKWLGLGEQALYYDGSTKENLIKFKNNPKVKVLVAVDASLQHGWNITEATRIIRLELNYTWGAEDQSFGRIFRPGQSKDVTYDIVLTDHTFEVTKFINVVTKHIVNAYVTTDWAEKFELKEEHLTLLPLNVETITTFNSFETAAPYAQVLDEMLAYEREVGYRKYATKLGQDYVDPPRARPISLKKIPVPYVKNADEKLDWYLDPRTGKPMKKPKFDFSLVASREELEKVKEELTETITEEVKEEAVKDRWYRYKAIADSPKFGIKKGDVWYLKRREEGDWWAYNARRKALIVITDATRKRALEVVRVVAPSRAKKLDSLLARMTGEATEVKKAPPQVDENRIGIRVPRGDVWYRALKGEKLPTRRSRRLVKRGMRRLVKGNYKMVALATILVHKYEVDEVYVFPRPSIGKNVWELFVPYYDSDLVNLRFKIVKNIVLVKLPKVEFPRKYRKNVRFLVKEEEEE